MADSGHREMEVPIVWLPPVLTHPPSIPHQVIGQCCDALRALDVSFSPHVSGSALSALLAACPNLEELDLGNCLAAASDQVLAAVQRSCCNLGSLYMEFEGGADIRPDAVSAEALVELARSCTKLQV